MDPEKKRFVWGIALAWVPMMLTIVPTLFSAFRGIGQEKATGLGAIAGSFAEAMVTFGLLSFVVCQIAGIVLLAGGIRREQWGRSMTAVVTIVCSVGILALTSLATWWLWHLRR
jgi:hypothetical protein